MIKLTATNKQSNYISINVTNRVRTKRRYKLDTRPQPYN